MVRRVTVKYNSLRSSLVNLPISLYGPLVANGTRPQSLAVHLSLPGTQGIPTKSAYVGWTGMASASSMAQWQNSRNEGGFETVEIDPQLATSFGFAEGATVEIGLIHDLPIAKSVATEPVSSDDWEILELHAGYVEDNLLSQVRAASVGQEIDVWVLGRTRVRFRVSAVDPPNYAVLLSTNTEVSIAPKARATANVPKHSGSWADTSKPSHPTDRKGIVEQIVLRVLPRRLMSNKIMQNSNPTVWVSRATFASIIGEDISSVNEQKLSHVSLRRLHPPVASSPQTSGSPIQNSPSQQPRLLHSGSVDTSGPSKGTTAISEVIALLCWLDDVPEKHFVEQSMREFGDWDLVSVKMTTEDRSKELQPRIASEPPYLSKQAKPPALAGVGHILRDTSDLLVNAFSLQGYTLRALGDDEHSFEANFRSPGLLLSGGPGSGRTSIAKEIARLAEEDPRTLAYPLYVDLSKYSEERISAIKSLFQLWFDTAIWHKPTLLILDNLDRVICPEIEHVDSFRFRHLAEHFISIFGPHPARGFVLLATCRSQSNLHPLITASHVFSNQIMIKPPDKTARRDILAGIVQTKFASSDLTENPLQPLNYASVATQTEGYSASDLRDLVSRAVHQATIRASKTQEKTVLDPQAFEAAQKDFTPLSLRDVKLQKSDIEWADIGGLHETRKVLRETLEWPTKYAAIFAKCPLRLRSGLLLYGFPGCGKTLLASAVAKECGLNFLSVKGPELLNKYIGASEKSVRDLFDRASAAKPCILFFDEFDSIAPKRGHDSTGVTDRVVNQMLTQMDGAEGLDGVYVLAATSRPDLIDPALLRPGRLDKSLLCDMPNKNERKEILQALCRKVEISPSVDLETYARLTEGFSGADLQALVYNAHLEVVHSSISARAVGNSGTNIASSDLVYESFGARSNEVKSRADEAILIKRLETILASVGRETSHSPSVRPPEKLVVQEEHLILSLRKTRPSVPPEERERLDGIYRKFIGERSGQLPVPPDAGGIGSRASLM